MFTTKNNSHILVVPCTTNIVLVLFAIWGGDGVGVVVVINIYIGTIYNSGNTNSYTTDKHVETHNEPSLNRLPPSEICKS